jgi:hypothetical protein
MDRNDFYPATKSAQTDSSARKPKKKKTDVGLKSARICDHTEIIDWMETAMDQADELVNRLQIIARALNRG